MSKKEYIVVEDKYIITDENGMRDPETFTNNFIDIEILETVIRYLQEQTEKDKKDLESKLYERDLRLADYKKQTLFATGASVVVPPVVSLLTGLHLQQTTTILGEMNGAVGFCISMIPGLMIGSQVLLSYGLSLRPSKALLNGKVEKIKYEEELLEQLSSDLVSLKLDTNTDRLAEYKEIGRGIIDDSKMKKYVKDSIGLRYAFGAQFKKVMKLYHSGELHDNLVESGMCEQAICDFMEFLESYNSDMNFKGELIKGM